MECIRRCLESVAWADEIVVVDSGSADSTEEICEGFTDRFMFHEWEGSNRQKQFALEQCSNDWVLSIDADEVVSPALAKNIQALMTSGPRYVGYKILRRNYYKDEPVDFGAMHSKPELRLFHRGHGRFAERLVHDKVLLDGPYGWVKGYLEHYNLSSISEWVQKNVRYAILSAEDDVARGKRVGFRHFAGLPGLFLRRYILWRGFLHGVPGLVFSAMPTYFRFIQYSTMWELQKEVGRRIETSSGGD